MDKYLRNAVFCDLFVKTNKKHILPTQLSDLLFVLQTKIKNNIFEMVREGGRIAYYVGDIEIDEDNNLATLYICQHNKSESDPAFSEKNEDSGRYDTEIIKKTENQGAATGGHIVVHLDGKPTDEGFKYLALVENVSGLGRSISTQLLRSIYNDIYVSDPKEMMAVRTTGSKTPEPYRPLFEFWGIPKELIENDLLKSLGVNMKVIRISPQKNMGHAASELRVEESVTLFPTKETGFPKDLNGILDIIKSVPGKLSGVTYAYKLNNTQQTLRFKFDGDIPFLDDAMVQKVEIGPTKSAMALITKNGKCHKEFKGLIKKAVLDKLSSLD